MLDYELPIEIVKINIYGTKNIIIVLYLAVFEYWKSFGSFDDDQTP